MLAFSYTSLLEVGNGMEMNLAILLTVCLFYLLTRSPVRPVHLIFGWIVATVLLATRFESPLLLAMLAIGLYFDGDRRPTDPLIAPYFSSQHARWSSFALLELWRHHEFGIWMPNTVYAKEWPPYSRWHGKKSLALWVAATITAVEIIFNMISIPLLLTLAVAANRLRRKRRQLRITPLRQQCSLDTDSSRRGNRVDHRQGLGLSRENGRACASLSFDCHRRCVQKRAGQPVAPGSVTARDGCLAAFLWLIVAAYASKPSTSIEYVRQIGLGADAIRTALREPGLIVLLPDVGGSSLYNEHLRILDSALLSNPELAKQGWVHFAEFFNSVRPDVFETHRNWASYQGAYTSKLLNNYSIVGAAGQRFFVRNDLFARLLANHGGKIVPVETSSSCLGGPLPADIAFSRSRKTCFVLTPDRFHSPLMHRSRSSSPPCLLHFPHGSFYLDDTVRRSSFQEYVSNVADPSSSPYSPLSITMDRRNRHHLLSLATDLAARHGAATPKQKACQGRAQQA